MANISTYGFTILHRNLKEIEPLIELDDITPHAGLINKKFCCTPFSMNSKVTFNRGMVLYSKLRPYLDKVIIAEQDGIATSEIVPFYSLINIDFLLILLKSPYFLSRVSSLMYGVKMPRLGLEDMRNTLWGIPPKNEQYRIVSKFNLIIREIQ